MTNDSTPQIPLDSTFVSVLLIAHGSRRAEANEDLVKLAMQISEQGTYRSVQVSYLELATPTILEGGRICASEGATCVLMLPYFLSAGVHVANDLEEVRQQLVNEFPNVGFTLCQHLGLHPLMTEIVLDRLNEGHSSHDPDSNDSTIRTVPSEKSSPVRSEI